MVNEFENCIDDSSDGSFGREEGVSPSSISNREAGDDDDGDDDDNGSDDSDGDYEEDPGEESEKDKTQDKSVVYEG